MSAEDVARHLRLWAIANNLIPRDHFPANAPVPAPNGQVAGVPAVTAQTPDLLRSRGINFIGFNVPENEVVIFTHKRVTKKLLGDLPIQGAQGVKITYQVSGPELIGKLPPSPFGTPPGSKHNNRYTCGSSIHVGNRLGAGTLGCLVRDQNGAMFGLTNNHVTGNCGFASVGLPIVAPGPCDVAANSIDPFCVGHHHSCLRMVHGSPDNPNVQPQNNSDAALFKIWDENSVTSMQKENAYDTPAAAGPLTPGTMVEKVGRTTGRTVGKVRAQISGAFNVRYKMAELEIDLAVFYEPMFVIEPTQKGSYFSRGGDSGSLVTHLDGNNVRTAVGLVFAGDDQGLSYVLPLQPILQSFNVSLVSGHNV